MTLNTLVYNFKNLLSKGESRFLVYFKNLAEEQWTL